MIHHDVIVGSPADSHPVVVLQAQRVDPGRLLPQPDVDHRLGHTPAAGLWRWRFRGGRTADTYVSLWGSVFDWLAGETVDLRGARPAAAWVRVGEPIRWRRGGMRDSNAVVILRRRATSGASSSSRADTLRLHFAGASTMTETRSLAAGVYATSIGAAVGLLTVNESAEWVPRRPTVRAGAIGSGAAAGRAPTARAAWWLYAIALTALCAEWILRRRIGLR